MSDDLNREIAELLGWTNFVVEPFSERLMAIPLGKDEMEKVPDFTGSLDALRPVYESLSVAEKQRVTAGQFTIASVLVLSPRSWAEALRDVLKERQDGAE